MTRTKSVRVEIAFAEADITAARADAIRAARVILGRRAGAPTEVEGAAAQPTPTRAARPVITA